jgi:DNA polymerase
MMKMSKPRKPTKDNPSKWHEKPSDLRKLFEYCRQDVRTEHALSEYLRDLSSSEQEVWKIDQLINKRGVQLDTDSVHSIIEMVDNTKKELIESATDITGGISPTQILELKKWIKKQGVKIPNMQAETLAKIVNSDVPEDVKTVIKIRKNVSKTSTAKYSRMLKTVCDDGRIRGTFMYSGAGPGRWTGKGVQLQNLPRKHYEDTEYAIELIKSRKYEELNIMFENPMEVASTLIRSMFIAKSGHDLICSDYKSIEGRVLAWLADEQYILDGYIDRKDMYKTAAAPIFGVEYKDVNSDQRQIGKTIELACGYQGGWKAFMGMATKFGIAPPDHIVPDPDITEQWYVACRKTQAGKVIGIGKKLTELEARFKLWAKPIVARWREARPKTTELWVRYHKAAMKVVSEGCGVVAVNNVKFAFPKGHDFLCIKLPSHRILSYYLPEIRKVMAPWGEKVDAVTYMGMNSKTKQWERKTGYGGKWAENVTQAVARDILAHGMLNVEASGYPVVLHAHDEAVSEVPENFGSLIHYNNLLCDTPYWAKGCPIEAEGWRGKRYKKG